jgi:NAD(P)-dependent dehydrogenase (short-subunit alcohol dehydrogenase family)
MELVPDLQGASPNDCDIWKCGRRDRRRQRHRPRARAGAGRARLRPGARRPRRGRAATTGRRDRQGRHAQGHDRVDVGEPAQIQEFAEAAIAAHPSLNIVVNNAGVALLGAFNEVDQAQMEWLFNINFWGVVHGTRAFLPHLSKQREAHIVNLSSIFGILAPPGQTAYCAAKFAVRGFSESLRHELAMANSPVKLSVVHPGGVLTNIVRNSRSGSGIADNARRAESIDRFDAIAKTTPPIAAQRIILGIEKNQPRILIGNDARFMDLLQRFRPATYWAVLAKRIGRAAEKKGK